MHHYVLYTCKAAMSATAEHQQGLQLVCLPFVAHTSHRNDACELQFFVDARASAGHASMLQPISPLASAVPCLRHIWRQPPCDQLPLLPAQEFCSVLVSDFLDRQRPNPTPQCMQQLHTTASGCNMHVCGTISSTAGLYTQSTHRGLIFHW